MEQKQVIEGNRIIMEFHGWVLKPFQTFDPAHNTQRPGSNTYYAYVKDGRAVRPEDIEFDIVYHQSWDALKPVIHEIFTYALAHPEQVDKIRNMSIVVDIMPCWEKCVEFIKWLNNHNSQTKPK